MTMNDNNKIMFNENNNTSDDDNGVIEFVLPHDLPTELVIVKAEEATFVPRPKPLFTDELVPPFVLGETDIRVELTHLLMLQQAARLLLAQAKREVFIISPDLEHDRFDNDDFIGALSAFARSSRYTTTRILVADPSLAVSEGHRLVKLARKLSSLIEIKQLHEDDIDNSQGQTCLVADDIGLLRCTHRDPWQGSLLPKGTPYAQQARSRFLEWWERGSEVADFREFSI
jgi:hypothetical protein